MSDDALIEQALAELDVPDRATRIGALCQLRGQQHENIIPHLIPLLRDRDSTIRRLAAEILGQNRSSAAVMALAALLYDPHAHVRIAAADALGQIADHSAVSALIDALYDDQIDVRFAAANALGLIADARAVFDLITVLDHDDIPLAMMAAQALMRIGTTEALAAIQHLRQGDDYNFGIPSNSQRSTADEETVRHHPADYVDPQTDETVRRLPPLD